MAKFPTYEEMAKNVAEKALDEFLYDGRSIREWMQIIASEDCISRRAAIDRIRSMEEWRTGDAFNADRVIKHIKDLPPVNPQKTGRWIYDKNIENWRCSECGETPKTLGYCGTVDFIAEHFKYCNHCGIRMVEPQERSGEE